MIEQDKNFNSEEYIKQKNKELEKIEKEMKNKERLKSFVMKGKRR